MKLPLIKIEYLTPEERAKSGCLPEVLHINDIALLLMSCSSDFISNSDDWHRLHRNYSEELERALRSGELRSLTGAEAIDFLGEEVAVRSEKKGVVIRNSEKEVVIPNSLLPLPQQTSLIHRDDFAAWLKQKGEWPLPKECLLSKWWPTKANIPSKPTYRIRINELREVIWTAYLALKKRHSREPTSGELWRELQRNYKEYDTEEVIDEIKKGIIYWTNFRGSEQRLKENSFKGTLCHIKKKRDISKNSN